MVDVGQVMVRNGDDYSGTFSRRFPPAIGWTVVTVLLIAEFILFRRFVVREVVWAYPPNTDQVAYLQQSYELFEQMRSHGVWHAVAHQPEAPQGAFLQLQAALLFRAIGGASRFAALSLNFFYFALFQVALVGSLRWLTGRWSIGFIGLGLLLTAKSPFNEAGGIYDFRIDFIAFCLYGTFLCFVIRSSVFARARWSALAGACGAVLICFRFIAAVYVVGLLAIVVVSLAIFALPRPGQIRELALQRIRGLLVACTTIALLAGPILWSRRGAIHDYYVVNHVTGAEKDVRAAEAGTTHLWDALAYYPRSLYLDHAGYSFAIAAAVVLACALIVFLRRRVRDGALRESAPTTFPIKPAVTFIAASLLLPLAVLTADVSKSPVVADIMVAPLIWLVMLGFISLTRADQPEPIGPPCQTAFGIAAIVLLGVGITVQARSYSHTRWMSQHRRGVERITAMCDLIADQAKARGWRDIAVFNDSVTDYLNVQSVGVLTYERHGYLLQAGDQFASLLQVPDAKVFALLGSSQFAILSHRIWPAPPYDYPINLELARLHPQLEAICHRDMTTIGRYRIFDREIDVFVRR